MKRENGAEFGGVQASQPSTQLTYKNFSYMEVWVEACEACKTTSGHQPPRSAATQKLRTLSLGSTKRTASGTPVPTRALALQAGCR